MLADIEMDYYMHTDYELGTVTGDVIEEQAHLHPGKRSSVDLNILTMVLILAPEKWINGNYNHVKKYSTGSYEMFIIQ